MTRNENKGILIKDRIDINMICSVPLTSEVPVDTKACGK
jgi:hypothetical protein